MAGLIALVAIAAALLWCRAHERAASTGGESRAATAGAADTSAPPLPRRLRAPIAIPAAAYAVLRGRVIRPDGEAVANATVTLVNRPVTAPAVAASDRSTATDDHGSFSFEHQLTGTYQLEARLDDAVSAAVTYHLSSASGPVTLVLFAGAAVEIEVVSAANGQPIAGAEVGLWSGDTEFGDVDLQRSATTDGRGIARLHGVVATSNHAVVARADGYADGYTNIIAAANPTLDGWRTRIELDPAATLSGTVVDAVGHPVAGALVGFAPDRNIRLPDGIMSPFLRAGRVGTAKSGEDGSFRLSVRGGTGCVTATAPGYQMGETCDVSVAIGSPRSGVTVQLGDGGAIRGMVVDADGTAVPGATVLLSQRGEDIEPMFRKDYRFQTRSDEHGGFEFTGVDRVPVVVYAFSEHASSPLVDVDLTSDAQATGVEVALKYSGEISGTVIEPSSEPVAYATVVYRPDHLSDNEGFDTEANLKPVGQGAPERWTMTRAKGAVRADAKGQFHIIGLPPGPYRLIASRPSPTSTSPTYGTAQERGILPGSDATLMLPALSALRGRVVAANGAPISEFGVSLAPGNFQPNTKMFPPPHWFAAKDGRFVLREIPDGNYRLLVTGPGLSDTLTDPFDVAGGNKDLGSISVRRGIARTGIVLDPAGKPVAQARVSIVAGKAASTTDSDRDGSFTLPSVAEDVPLRVKAATETASSDWVDVGPRQTKVELRLSGDATGGMTGALVDPGQPLEGRTIALTDPAAKSPDDMPPVRLAVTAAGGLFKIETVPSGTYTLWVHRPEGKVEDLDERGIPTWTRRGEAVVIRPNQVTDVAVVLPPTQ